MGALHTLSPAGSMEGLANDDKKVDEMGIKWTNNDQQWRPLCGLWQFIWFLPAGPSWANWKKLFCNQMLNEDLQPCFQLQPLGQLSWPGRVEKVADSLCISNLCLNVICCHTSHLFNLDFPHPWWIGFDLNSFHLSKVHREFTLMRYPDPNQTFEQKSWM